MSEHVSKFALMRNLKKILSKILFGAEKTKNGKLCEVAMAWPAVDMARWHMGHAVLPWNLKKLLKCLLR